MTDTPVSDKDLAPQSQKPVQSGRVLVLAALIATELVALSLLYTHNFTFVCRDVAPAPLCEFLSRSVIRAIVFLGACLIFALARPHIRQLLFRHHNSEDRMAQWYWVQLTGFVLILLPWTFTVDGAPRTFIITAFLLWILGAALATLGAAFILSPPGQWRKAAQELGPVPLTILTAAVFAPEIADLARGLWWIEPLTQFTFRSVVATLDLFGVSVIAKPELFVIGTPTFAIAVGSQCAGMEGFALITLFLLCYFYAFKDDLRFPHVWVLLPIGLALSWTLNVVRIAVLFMIGNSYSPDLAVNGFHSHAGWLMFSILALSIIGVSRTVPWFRQHISSAKPTVLPLTQDWIAACIVPFAAFMGASLILSTFTQAPGLWYAIKVVFMAGALAMFLPLYRRVTWRIDPLALIVGVAIGVLWIALSPAREAGDDQLQTALNALPAGLLAGWVIVRIIGTVVLVPMVEELFFRGYVLDRLDWGGMGMRLVALGVSAGLFAVFHDRWVIAAIVGVAYGLFYLRRRNVSDAITAHASSNAVIALYAVILSDWSVI